MVDDGPEQSATFTRVKVPDNLAPFLPLEAEGPTWRGVPMVDVIRAHLHLLIPDKNIDSVALFRLTRSAEVSQDDEVAEDLVEMIEGVLERRRMAPGVRLEVTDTMSDAMLHLLMSHLDIHEEEVYRHAEPLDMTHLGALLTLDRPDLQYPEWTPQPHPRLYAAREEQHSSIFEEIKRGDILLHHPYHSFVGTTQRFFNEAATDPAVLAIKVSIYRTDNDSSILQSLMDAAAEGKQVAVTIELKARFDERQNVGWVRQLEQRGVHVAYGAIAVKTHTKLALVVRQEADGVRLYSHIGTGNYHAGTASTYVDLAVLTANHAIGSDVVRVFNMFTGPGHEDHVSTLLIAPHKMRQTFIDNIRREAAHAREDQPARIIIKVNALEDPEITRELYQAAQAGVAVDLIVRDICRLRPGLEGVTETVRVHSLVGRFLEHSRIFFFENAGQPLWYLGSADWMKRNLDKRMEAVAPIHEPALQHELWVILETILSDNRRRWMMQPDGSYVQMQPQDDEPVVDAQEMLMQRARQVQDGP
jgi:polyphosphate kinase